MMIVNFAQLTKLNKLIRIVDLVIEDWMDVGTDVERLVLLGWHNYTEDWSKSVTACFLVG